MTVYPEAIRHGHATLVVHGDGLAMGSDPDHRPHLFHHLYTCG